MKQLKIFGMIALLITILLVVLTLEYTLLNAINAKYIYDKFFDNKINILLLKNFMSVLFIFLIIISAAILFSIPFIIFIKGCLIIHEYKERPYFYENKKNIRTDK